MGDRLCVMGIFHIKNISFLSRRCQAEPVEAYLFNHSTLRQAQADTDIQELIIQSKFSLSGILILYWVFYLGEWREWREWRDLVRDCQAEPVEAHLFYQSILRQENNIQRIQNKKSYPI